MHRLVILSVLVAAPFALAIPPTQQPEKEAPKAPADPWCGYYECAGKESTGGTYDGIVVIRRVRSVYTCQWTIGNTVFVGVGQLVEGKLAIGWAQQRDDKVIRGLTVYEVSKDGISGLWCSMPGDGNKHKEDLKLLKRLPPGE